MTVETSATCFIVTFAVGPTLDPPAERLALINGLLRSGLGAGVDVLDHAFLPDSPRTRLIVLVEAASHDALRDAIRPAEGAFTVTIDEPAELIFDREAPDATHAIFTDATSHDAESSQAAPVSSAGVRVRMHARLPVGAPLASVSLVCTPDDAAASEFAQRQVGPLVTETVRVQPVATYVDAVRAMTSRDLSAILSDPASTAPPIEGTGATVAGVPQGPDTYTVTSLSGPLILLGSGDWTPFGASMALTVLPEQTPTALSGRQYLWVQLKSAFEVIVNWSNANNFWWVNQGYIGGDLNWAYPIAVLPGTPGLDYTIDVGRENIVEVESELSDWLNGLMLSVRYEADWPEDSYTGGLLAAYDYILDQLPGRTPPKNGTITEPEEIEVIPFPRHASFTSAEFTQVKNQLLLEIGHFATAAEWFGPNGIINVINTQVSVLSTNDLIIAAEAMSLPPQAPMTWSLDEIMNVISSVVGVIPEIGSYLSAVVTVGYDVAKSVMPQQANEPIEAAVSEIGQQLNDYLISMVQSSALQHEILMSNWGRLKEFSDGAATGKKISVQQFYGTGGPGSGTGASPVSAGSADSGPLAPPPQYLGAIANGWLTFIYQQLFATQHPVSCTISFSDEPIANPFYPAVGSFHYVWTLPCVWIDTDGNWHPYGNLVFDCTTDAPTAVMIELFAPSSPLQVNPVEFFLGINGWPQVIPHYRPGYESISTTIPWPPIVRLGLDSWGALPG